MRLEKGVISTRRKNKRGEYVAIHVYRPTKAGGAPWTTLKGTDPTTKAYQDSLAKAMQRFDHWQANQPRKAGTVDDNGKRITNATSRFDRYTLDVPADDTTMLWLVGEFEKSPQYQSGNVKTQKAHSALLREVCRLPYPKRGPGVIVGDCRFVSLRKEDVQRIRQRFTHKPGKADCIVSSLRAMFYWAMEVGHYELANPAAHLGKLRDSNRGIPRCNDDQHDKICAKYPLGTRQRLAFDVALYTGGRVIDLHMLGPQHVKSGWLTWTEGKNKGSTAIKRKQRSDKVQSLPVHPELAKSIAATPHSDFAFITQANGLPYKNSDTLSHMMREWARQAGVKVSAHGMRKRGATQIIDEGGSEASAQVFLGHTTPAETQHYVRERDKRRRAQDAVKLLVFKKREAA